ncbi:MAG: hypothetical protein AABX59_01665 [Nanoarchaeota archaeon]
MDKRSIAFVLAFVAGLWSILGSYQGLTGAAITGNVVGANISSASALFGLLVGLLIFLGSVLLLNDNYRRGAGIFLVVVGVSSALITLGALLIPGLVAVVAGLLLVTREGRASRGMREENQKRSARRRR